MSKNIDSHQHFWRYDPARDVWITDAMQVLKRDFLPSHLATELDANGIDASIAVQADQSEGETMFLLDVAERSERVAWGRRSSGAEPVYIFLVRFAGPCAVGAGRRLH